MAKWATEEWKATKEWQFNYQGTCITDPYLDETGRFKVSDPIKYYGMTQDHLNKWWKVEEVESREAIIRARFEEDIIDGT
jgi:hypothetical protein